MRIGIMGLHDGHIRGMVRSAEASADAEIIGVVEPDEQVWQKWERDWPRYASLADLLDKGRPELILEGLNHAEKTVLVEQAAAAGVHLVLDKPLCRTLDDWHRMARAVKASGIVVTMWFTSRRYPPFAALREHITSGRLGELVSLVSTHPHKLGAGAPSWYYDPAVYTGIFHDLGCHGVDQIRWLTGAEYAAVHAVSTRKKYQGTTLDDHMQASFQLTDGSCGVVTADWLTPQAAKAFGDTRFIIMGTKGSAHLRAYAGQELLIVDDQVVEPVNLTGVETAPYVQDVIAALKQGEQPEISTADVFAVAKACLLAQESARQCGQVLAIG